MEMDHLPLDCQPIYHDRPEWLAKPDFWALHVFGFCRLHYGCKIPKKEIVDAFKMPAAEIWKFGSREYMHTSGSNGYRCYRVMLPLPEGRGIAFEDHDFPEDHHMQFRMYPLGDAKGAQIGGYNGQSWDAEISWPELKAISKSVREATTNTLFHAATIPLLFPGMLFAPVMISGKYATSWRHRGLRSPQ